VRFCPPSALCAEAAGRIVVVFADFGSVDTFENKKDYCKRTKFFLNKIFSVRKTKRKRGDKMKKISTSLILALIFALIPVKASAQIAIEDENSVPLSENDILLIEKAVQSSAPDAPFSVLVMMAQVLINRYRSDIYPNSMIKIIEAEPSLTISYLSQPSDRVRCAVYYALIGTAPMKEASGIKKLSEESFDFAEYMIIDGCCFYTE